MRDNLRIRLESKPGKQPVCILDYEKGEIIFSYISGDKLKDMDAGSYIESLGYKDAETAYMLNTDTVALADELGENEEVFAVVCGCCILGTMLCRHYRSQAV